MLTHKKDIVESKDEFSEMPPLKAHSYSLPCQESELPGQHTGSHRSKLDTHGYTVKKITNSFDTTHKKVNLDQGLNSVSIETNSHKEEGLEASEHQVIAGTTIETGEFTSVENTQQPTYPVIIDETDEYDNGTGASGQPALLKKERLPQQQNISLDISPEYCIPEMPSENDQEQIGSGRIVGTLGSGGMARVYKTWNEKLEIFRAVKILLPTNQKEQWDRFLTEAKITAKLHHPNITETYDTGEWHGLLFIEMEIIEGDTLNGLISSHCRLPSPVCSAVALQISKALSYAHSQEIMIYGKTYNGIIHRDLKPSNIMLTSSGEVKLMDFGVARPIETGLHTIATDSIVGTMHYFSPEQISGYPVDTLSDVYSFGAVLYDMLCGINPFPQTNMVNLVQAKTRNQFTRIEDFHLNIDLRLASVAQTCLRTDKKERFTDFNTIRKTLEEIHRSYDMGSPEEVIAAFYRNPEQVQRQFEYHIGEQQKALKEVSEKVASLVMRESTIEKTHQTGTRKAASKEVAKLDSWESKEKTHRYKVIAAVVIFLIVIVTINSIIKGKFLNTEVFTQKYEQLLNVVEDRIGDKDDANIKDEIDK